MKLSSIIASRHRDTNQDLLFTVDASINTTLTITNLSTSPTYNYSGLINWGDGSADTPLTGVLTGTSIPHTFGSTGTFQVRVSGAYVPFIGADAQTNVVSVESLGNIGLVGTNTMFRDCTNLVSARTGNNIPEVGTSIFNGCTSLTSINLPGSGNMSLGIGAIKGCTSLTSFVISNNFVGIGNSAFEDCSNLASMTIGSGVSSLGTYVFRGCTSLGSISCLATTAPTLGTGVFGDVSATTIDVPIGATGYGSTYGGLTVNYVL
jgi:hypothetical protein